MGGVRMTKNKIVYIEWIDSTFEDSYLRDGEDFAPMALADAGFLVRADKKKVIFATQWDEEGKRWRYIHTIPKPLIKKIVILKVR